MISIQVEGADKVAEDFARMAKNIPIQSEKVLDNIAGQTKQTMIARAPRASGTMAESINVLSSPGTRVIGPGVDYAYWQENRDRASQSIPSWQPGSKVFQWAQIKGFTSTSWGGNEKAMAFLIARKIAREGYKAQTTVKDTFYWLSEQITGFLSGYVSAILSGAGTP